MSCKAMRSITLPIELLLDIDDLVQKAKVSATTSERIGVQRPARLSVDERGFTPEDYVPLQKMVGGTKLTGKPLFEQVLRNPGLRHGAMRHIRQTLARNNQIIRRQNMPGRGINFSSVVEALITKGMESVTSVNAATTKSNGRSRRDARKAA